MTIRSRPSHYNPTNALNYARLAFKAVCRDQGRAEIEIGEIFRAHDDPLERIRRVALALTARIEDIQERAQ